MDLSGPKELLIPVRNQDGLIQILKIRLDDALFVCIGGVNAIHGLKNILMDLGVREVVEAMDMDQMTNENVPRAVLEMRREVQSIPGIKYSKYT